MPINTDSGQGDIEYDTGIQVQFTQLAQNDHECDCGYAGGLGGIYFGQFVSVTAFDFGFPAGNIPPRESNKLNSITESFPQNNVDSVEQYNLDVYIYPNPYRIDANYIERGFENRDGAQANQRAHRVHFVNLPRVCKITIYSLDGDRIDSFDHNFPQGGPEAMHDEWDMITRNSLIPVSGIYYWVVEAETRTQTGKLIIIR